MKNKLYSDDRERGGYTISSTKKGLKLATWTAYWDDPNYTFFVEETKNFNRHTDFSKLWNNHMTYGEYFMEWVSEWVGTPDQNKYIYRITK